MEAPPDSPFTDVVSDDDDTRDTVMADVCNQSGKDESNLSKTEKEEKRTSDAGSDGEVRN